MQVVHFTWGLLWFLLSTFPVNAAKYNITLSNDGPVVLGGTITFKADFFESNGERPSGTFKYQWRDNALSPHEYEVKGTSNTTTYWSINYPRENYSVGIYDVEVVVSKQEILWWERKTSVRTSFYVTEFLNGDVEIIQPNKTVGDEYVSTASEANMTINVRKGDADYLKTATTVSTYWFIDCRYYGQTSDLNILYNFTNPDVSHLLEALVVASFEPPTTLPPPITTTATTVSLPTTEPNVTISNITTEGVVTTVSSNSIVTEKPISTSVLTSVPPNVLTTAITPNNDITNISIHVPYICSNATIIPPDPDKTYGHFTKRINVRAPIMNVTVEGTNWIQPWDMLSLNVTCKGSGPFYKCLHFQRGKYNVTGNETCDSVVQLNSCNFSIIHYFLEPSVYTILIIMNNDVSKQIYPLTINIYKVTTKPQLSVIVVPVSCSLAAVVLIVFGIAYYIQSRARFTVEVADFDFGQSNPEMEYKTFTERLRDSFNNTIRPGNKRISVRRPYYGSMNH
ncbi:hypothetical protein WN55_07725 [Dufourea novaeangliae]|uniref:Transmembrane protein 130 n=1 Tax=Dufourea novaeangliae TaxID=178035 RepID=A0A154P7K8_DUFNO|nr:hypothetical protein WN55_07725 [Dufourea novaeangliae]